MSDEEYARGIAAIVDSPELAPGLADVRQTLGDAVSRGAAIAACEEIERDAPAESVLLREQLRALEDGMVPAGDLRRPFRCAMTLLALSAAVVAAVGPGGPGGPVVYVGLGAAGCTWFAMRRWVSDKCPVPSTKASPVSPTPEPGDLPAP